MKFILLLICAVLAVSQVPKANGHIDNLVGAIQDLLWELELFCSDEEIHELAILFFGPLGVDFDWFLDWLGGVGPFKLKDRENLLHDVSNVLELLQGNVSPEDLRCVVNELLRTLYLNDVVTPEEIDWLLADCGLGGVVAFVLDDVVDPDLLSLWI